MLNVCADLVQFDQYSLQLYNYAMVERFRSNQFFNYGNFVADSRTLSRFFKPSMYAAAAAAAAAAALLADASGKLGSQAPKPQYSYIGLIAIAILSSPEKKLVLSDIYQHILDNYSYFRSRGPGWRNSIRHNLSLNDCFIKAGRSAHGKGHYWAVHPANVEDFLKGDFRRRKAQRKVRRHMGLTSDDDIYDNSSPRQFAFSTINTPPAPVPPSQAPQPPLSHQAAAAAAHHQQHQLYLGPGCLTPSAVTATATHQTTAAAIITMRNTMESFSRKRQFDVESLLRPDDGSDDGTISAPVGDGGGGYKRARPGHSPPLALPPPFGHMPLLATVGPRLSRLPKATKQAVAIAIAVTPSPPPPAQSPPSTAAATVEERELPEATAHEPN
ncbi:fork head domain-containing protein FD5 [Anopheles darlingi]|uniref:fork head domain-containing protein FD5 n=1 Tax=Anopheles darlingi TaxID=43151 RepID=UPI00210015C2|nr:fork head domain-containing protein FD5 [Anopheles darlingi]